jgi:hypothetical protein
MKFEFKSVDVFRLKKGFEPRIFSNSIKGFEWILNLKLNGFDSFGA